MAQRQPFMLPGQAGTSTSQTTAGDTMHPAMPSPMQPSRVGARPPMPMGGSPNQPMQPPPLPPPAEPNAGGPTAPGNIGPMLQPARTTKQPLPGFGGMGTGPGGAAGELAGSVGSPNGEVPFGPTIMLRLAKAMGVI